jgi:hypothetical protein
MTQTTGLHADEAVTYLSRILRAHENDALRRPVYAITGTGHHSRGSGSGKDKVGRAVRAFLAERRYAWREFSAPGDRNAMGGILGIDPASCERERVTLVERSPAAAPTAPAGLSGLSALYVPSAPSALAALLEPIAPTVPSAPAPPVAAVDGEGAATGTAAEVNSAVSTKVVIVVKEDAA